MREIRFRATDFNGNTWRYGFYYKDEDGDHCIIDDFNPTNIFIVNPETVTQYTGLKDKNGKEIYEGDIVRCKEYENNGMVDFNSSERDIFSLEELKGKIKEEYVLEVLYREANFFMEDDQGETPLCCFFGNMKHSQPIFEIEVIGNMIDNPELLIKNK